MSITHDKVMLHGGDLSAAIGVYGGDRADWLDVSSGINHQTYPFDGNAALAAINSLPSQQCMIDCLAAARKAYGAGDEISIVASPGTQALIQAMPVLLASSQNCLILGPTFSEHQRAMARAGVDVAMIQALPEEYFPGDCVLVVNPNNPDGRRLDPEDLIKVAKALEAQDGLLIVDEAFADLTPELSVVPQLADIPNCVVMRSFGKFYGLGGIRLGFLLGNEKYIERIRDLLGPWAVSSPALKIGTEALSDLNWQVEQRAGLRADAAALDDVLGKAGLIVDGGTDLFRLALVENAKDLHVKLAQERIWTRIFDYRPDFIRFGIPRTEEDRTRLAEALARVRNRWS